MTTESPETNVTTDAPAEKQKRRLPSFAKKNVADTTSDTNESPATKRSPHGVYLAGALLLAGGVGAAIASKLGKTGDDTLETSSDTTDVA